jgi:hypothetical protein
MPNPNGLRDITKEGTVCPGLDMETEQQEVATPSDPTTDNLMDCMIMNQQDAWMINYGTTKYLMIHNTREIVPSKIKNWEDGKINNSNTTNTIVNKEYTDLATMISNSNQSKSCFLCETQLDTKTETMPATTTPIFPSPITSTTSPKTVDPHDPAVDQHGKDLGPHSQL